LLKKGIQKRASFKEEAMATVVREDGSGGKKWIQKAIKHPGALHRQMGVPAGEKIPKAKIAAAAKKGGKLGARARLAQTLAKMRK
jgi:hypothetical protein